MMAAKIGLGCVTFGREIDGPTAFKLMEYALANGIDLFDTAAAYGKGASEQIVGRWLSAHSAQKPLICTKILPPYSSASVSENIEISLHRLQTSKIDILYLHHWHDTMLDPAVWRTLNELQRKGRIGAVGVSNLNGKQLAEILKVTSDANLQGPEYLQNNHNLAVSDLCSELMDLCADNDLKLITFSPLGAGFLTGKHLQGVAPGSRFDIMPAHQDIYFNGPAKHRLDKLIAVSEQTGYSPALLAMAWALHQPVDTVLIGGRTTAHIDLALEAQQLNLPEVFEELVSA